jgi:hypothetical protein
MGDKQKLAVCQFLLSYKSCRPASAIISELQVAFNRNTRRNSFGKEMVNAFATKRDKGRCIAAGSKEMGQMWREAQTY